MKRKYIQVGKFINGTGENIKENIGIIVENDTIVDIEEIRENLNEFEVYDYRKFTVMPGMMNCHVHLGMVPVGNPLTYYRETSYEEFLINTLKQLEDYIDSGVTYIRNLGTPKYLDVKLRDLVKKGKVKGPSIVASGPVLCMTGGHGHFFGIESDGVDECRKSAREIIKNGADCVKIMSTGGVLTDGVEPGSPQLEYEEIKAAVEEAKKAGKITSTHAHGLTGIKNAIKAGIDSVEHGTYMDDEAIEMMIERGTYLVPTLAAPYFILKAGLENGVSEDSLRKCQIVDKPHREAVIRAYKKGVKIAVGSDAGTSFNEHGKTYCEIKLLVEAGMSNMEAIVAATKTSSELLKVDKYYGTLEIGKKADIVVLRDNPLDNIATLENVASVFKHGNKVK